MGSVYGYVFKFTGIFSLVKEILAYQNAWVHFCVQGNQFFFFIVYYFLSKSDHIF